MVKKLNHFLRFKLSKPKFDGKTVFITGGSSGIGEELCKRFVELGAKKVIIAARRLAELERVKQECKFPERVQTLVLDLAEPRSCLDLAQRVGGDVDIVVNNGGIS